MRYSLDGRTILVTGASTGIGAALAHRLGERAGLLILTARSGDLLEDVASKLNCATRVVPSDLATGAGVDELLAAIADVEIDVLINNAGVGLGGRFAEQDERRLQSLIELNVVALARLTRKLLPGMLARGHGAIMNVGSTAGDQGLPFLAAYAASKAFVNNFSEGLRWELRGSGVVVSALTPGSTRTPFFERGGIPADEMLKMSMSPERVAAAGIRALERGRARCVPGLANRILLRLQHYSPRPLVGAIVYRLFSKGQRPISK